MRTFYKKQCIFIISSLLQLYFSFVVAVETVTVVWWRQMRGATVLACEGAQVNCVAVQTYLFYHNNHITSLKGKEGCNRVFVWIDP